MTNNNDIKKKKKKKMMMRRRRRRRRYLLDIKYICIFLIFVLIVFWLFIVVMRF